MKRFLTTGATLSLFLSPFVFGLPTTQPTAELTKQPKQPTTAPAPGTFEAYQVDGTAALKHYKQLVPDNELLADANAQRAATAEKVIPLLKQIVSDLDEMTLTKPAYKWPVMPVRANAQAELYALGDADTVSALDTAAKLPGREGIRAKRIVLQGRWYMAGEDPAKQGAVISDLDQLASAQPEDAALSMMISEMGSNAKDPDVKQHMVDLLTNTMDNMTADALVKKMQNQDKTRSFEGKPMVLSGKLPDGKSFTTADWAGKVVLVDFWAAWCTPCKAELPRVQKVYDQYHEKGFEVLGIDNDYSAKAVMAYASSAKLPWPQLFDAAAGAKTAWNPITVNYGIDGIPVMFLIDKKGVCRSVKARDDFERLIPQLLSE